MHRLFRPLKAMLWCSAVGGGWIGRRSRHRASDVRGIWDWRKGRERPFVDAADVLPGAHCSEYR
jgi:hypothetical protein